MAVNETIVTGRKFRKLVDEANKIWQRISFWTKASDVEFDDGMTAEEKLGNFNGISSDINDDSDNIAASMKVISMLRQSFQDGCDKIVGKLTTLNHEPTDPKGPEEINTEIENIYNTRYTQGYSDGLSKSINSTNAKITYKYHDHSSCTKIYNKIDCHWKGSDDHQGEYDKCPNCGSAVWKDYQESSPHYLFYCKGDNNGKNNPNSFKWSCGKTTSTVKKVEIEFE